MDSQQITLKPSKFNKMTQNWVHPASSAKVPYGAPDGKVDCGLNTSRPREDGRLFVDDIFKRISFNENVKKTYSNFTEICSSVFI